ncbi:MAG: peptidoglycan-binding protein [Pseudomonadota bacterium]|nr:peptidoglycan-binding protein [Pseudomonadota bacterium]
MHCRDHLSLRAWSCALSVLFVILAALLPASAADMAWQFSEGNDPDNKGRMTARLTYGVPETDAIRVQGICEARSGTSVKFASLTFGADVGPKKNGDQVNLRFSGDGFDHLMAGSVQGIGEETGVAGVHLDIDNNDPLWRVLTTADSVSYLVPGRNARTLELRDGHGNISNFIRACRTYEDAVSSTKVAQAGPPSQSDSGGDVSEKEAFDAAKELGTIEAWEAFLNNYPSGFRADLARAYVKRLASDGPPSSSGGAAPSAAVKPPVTPPPAGDADLSVSQTAAQAGCGGNIPCGYTITVKNEGGKPFRDQLVIANALAPGGGDLIASGPAPWLCQGAGGGAVCTLPNANIAPGQSQTLSLTFNLPGNSGGGVNSCAQISWGGAPSATGVRDVQQALNARGFNAGAPDGQAGPQTLNALRNFQTQAGMQPSGEVDLPLLIALFTQPGDGDADPGNDAACAGSAVFGAPVANAGPPVPSCPRGQFPGPQGCTCPPDEPIWTGRSCLPRLATNCTGGRVFDRTRKLCICPGNRPFWYNGRCNVAFDDCPGDSVRVGSRCVKENDPVFAGRPPRGGGFGCPPGQTRVGNSCVAQNVAPIFALPGIIQGLTGNQPQTGGRPPQGGGGAPQFTGRPPQTQNGTQFIVLCNGGRVVNNRCFCPQNTVLQGGNCVAVVTPQTTQPTIQQVIPQILGAPGGCSGGRIRQGNKCVCPAGQTFTGAACVASAPPPPPPPPIVKQVTTPPPPPPPPPPIIKQVKPTCGAGQIWNGSACVTKGPDAPPPPPPPPPIVKGSGCPGGLVKLPTGGCGLPQCGPGQIATPGGCVNLSDRRVKRDIEQLAVLDDGTRIYAFRYLWDDTVHVGVMAQDLLSREDTRDAVITTDGGYYAVDYARLGLRMATYDEWKARGTAAVR